MFFLHVALVVLREAGCLFDLQAEEVLDCLAGAALTFVFEPFPEIDENDDEYGGFKIDFFACEICPDAVDEGGEGSQADEAVHAELQAAQFFEKADVEMPSSDEHDHHCEQHDCGFEQHIVHHDEHACGHGCAENCGD